MDKNQKNKFRFSGNFSLNFVVVIILLCSLIIIGVNYLFTKQTIKQINSIIEDYEYSKTGGEENYKLLREIQKEQMIGYLDDLSEKNPEYIEEIKNKINPEYKKTKFLTKEEIEIIQTTSSVLGDKKAGFSIIEFSDFECNYCKEFHNKNIVGEIIDQNPNWNYIFKNMPNKNHTNAKLISQYTKCIETNSGSGTIYFDFVKNMFEINLENDFKKEIENFLQKNNLGNIQIENCINNEEINLSLEKEFGQGIYFGVKSTPSIIFLDNNSGKFILLELEDIEKEKFLETIELFKK